jgi:hypothetical protein
VLRWRAATALILAPIALAGIALGERTIFALLLLLIAGAAYELSRALEPLPFVAALGAGALPLLLSIPFGRPASWLARWPVLPWALFWLAGKPEVRTLRAVLASSSWRSGSAPRYAHLGPL